MNKNRIRRSGFTLLELILALGISIVVMGAIASSIYICLSSLTTQQREIEQKQVARNVLAMVSSDVRAALQYKPADVTGLDNLAVSQAMAAGIVATSTDDADPAAPEGNADTESEAGSTEEPVDPEECVSCRPTMIGTEEVLMIDISRLPRIDEYNPMVAMRADPQLPSDVKGVTYFLGEPDPRAGNTGRSSMFTDELAKMGGLYRRQIDRAVASYSGEQGAISEVDDFTELIAPEIAELRFRYFDGTDWLSSWDSVESDSFPVAIEVVVVIDPVRTLASADDYRYAGFDSETMQQYRKVIHLPISDRPEE